MSVSLSEHLPLLAEAPDGIKKLRGLILELAVRGKLVPQDLSDEPASELLKRIAAEKARLVAEGKIKKDKPLPPVDADKTPFSLPVGWEWVRLDQICHDWGQKTPDAPFTYIDVSAIDNLRGNIEAPSVVAASDAPSRARKLVRQGTVIYSTVRPYLLNIAVIDRVLNPEPIASTAFAVLHPLAGILSRYVFWYLRSPVFVRYVESVQTGIAYPAINDTQFFGGVFPLSPIAEQHRIVAKVDELMALCDRMETEQADAEAAHATLVQTLLGTLTQSRDATELAANWQRLSQHFDTLFTTEASLDALKQTILQLAVMGKLVAQEPGDEPASFSVDLVSKEAIKAVQAGVIRRYGFDEPIDDSGLSELPPGWRWSRLVEITRPEPYAIKRGPFGSAIRKDMFVPNGFKVYEQQHAISGDFTKGRYYITEAKFEELRAFELHPNEILVSCSGTVGKVAIVPESIEHGVINQALLKLSLHQSALLNEYFLILFPAFFMETDTLVDLQGTAQKNIPGMDVLKRMPFPLPPLAEQHRIVAKVDELMALCDSLKADVAESRARQARLATTLIESALAA